MYKCRYKVTIHSDLHLSGTDDVDRARGWRRRLSPSPARLVTMS